MRRIAALTLVGAMPFALLSAEAPGGSKELRVGLVLDDTFVSRAYQRLPLEGLQRAVRELHVQGKVIASRPVGGYLPSFSDLARQKYDLIIALGINQAYDLEAAARKFPGRKFVILDTAWEELVHRPKNVLGSSWRVEEPSYLAGYLAGRMERRRPGRDVIGSVGGFPIRAVKTYIAGFEAGARKADPDITTLRGYAGDFFNPAKCKSVALSQIAKGTNVIFNVAGACGPGALEAAKEKGVWGIGVDVDQSYLGPHVLTSVLKRWDVEVYETIEALVEGKLRTGRSAVWGLHNGAVGLGKISPRVPRSLVRQVDRIRAQIAAGKIAVPSTLSGQ